MGLLIVAGVVALVLTLLTLVTVTLVQLVLLVSVRKALVVMVVMIVHWFVASRRRQVAKGFYSCTRVPERVEMSTTENYNESKRARHSAASALETMAAQEEEEKSSEKDTLQPSLPSNETYEPEERHSITSVTSEVESRNDEIPVATAPRSAHHSPWASPSMMRRLPELRHRKWKQPTRSLSFTSKGTSRLQEHKLKESDGGSASNSPRRPELYESPRSVAMEQKLMKSALESDGYWIGDFRAPSRSLPKRSNSMDATKTTTSSPLYRRTSSRAV